MNKYVLVIIVVVLVGVASCLKTKETEHPCTTYDPCALVAPASEVTKVEEYLAAQSISGAVKHCSGTYYLITNPGTGASPTACATLQVNYKGRLTNGTIFDSTATGVPATFELYRVIKGWQNTLPLIKRGGTIRLFIPPSLGYGSSSNGSIPASSVLVFDVELLDFL